MKNNAESCKLVLLSDILRQRKLVKKIILNMERDASYPNKTDTASKSEINNSALN